MIRPFCNKVLNRIQKQYIQLRFCSFSDQKETSDSPVIPDCAQKSSVADEGVCLQPVPKKNYGLSKVEEENLELVESLKRGNTFYPYSDPYERCAKIVLEDMKCTLRKVFYNLMGVKLGPLEPVFFPRHTDILIIGGGILGLTIAYTIKNTFPFGSDIIVVDRDCNFPPLSTNLTQSMVTHQLFADEEEIPILKYSAEFFSSFSQHTNINGLPPFKLPYEPLGSLVLVEKSNIEQALERIELLKKYEIPNKVLDNETLKRKFPWLNSNGIIFGSMGMGNEGLIDPWAYLQGVKSKCLALGVKFVTAEVIDFGYKNGRPCRGICKLPDGSYNSINFGLCVLACGMEALNFTKILNSLDSLNIVLKLPVQEKMRYEYCFYNPDGPGLNTPMVIDSNGTYFRREGLLGYYVAGAFSVPCNDDEENTPCNVFENRVKPFLMERVPKFDKLQLVKGWVDLQESCSANDTGILGFHPELSNIMYALGFSHMGLQYVPAAARAAMENIFYDEYQTIDFTSFNIENLWKKRNFERERRHRELLESKRRVAISD